MVEQEEGGTILEKWIAAALQAAAGVLFVLTGDTGEVGILFPALAAGVAGLLLWGKAARGKVRRPEQPRSSRIESQVARMEETLVALQEDVGDLRQDRDFYRELYGSERERELLSRPRGGA
jgi:hypothetical protein